MRDWLMDDTGYHGLDECSNWETCNEEAYRQGRADAINELLMRMKERAEDSSDIPNMFDKGYYQAYEHLCEEAEQLKEQR